MRPIQRGAWPLAPGGAQRAFAAYADARGELIERLGEYCSYCEIHLDAALAVEHVQPKVLNPALALAWNNFLLACPSCNAIKLDQQTGPDDVFWPDVHNTARAIRYRVDGLVDVDDRLPSAEHRERARRTIDLTGLDRTPQDDPQMKDRRWRNRREAWGLAERALDKLRRHTTDDMREQIVDTAVAKGFWSVWMTVFRDHPDMQRRFIDAYPGTATDAFDVRCHRVCRPSSGL